MMKGTLPTPVRGAVWLTDCKPRRWWSNYVDFSGSNPGINSGSAVLTFAADDKSVVRPTQVAELE